MAAVAASTGMTNQDYYMQKAKKAFDTFNAEKGKLTKSSKLYKVMKGINALGERYFGSHKTGYVSSNLVDEDGNIIEPEIKMLNEKQFKREFEEEMGAPIEVEEASFSDAYRHAGLLNVETWDVVDPATECITFNQEGNDYVFTWPMINILPEVLKKKPFIAIHADTEDMLSLLIPLPGSHNENNGNNGNYENNNEQGGGARKTRRHHRKITRHRRKTYRRKQKGGAHKNSKNLMNMMWLNRRVNRLTRKNLQREENFLSETEHDEMPGRGWTRRI